MEGGKAAGLWGTEPWGWNMESWGCGAGTWGDVVTGHDVEPWVYGVRPLGFLHTHWAVLPSFVFNLINFCISCSEVGAEKGQGTEPPHPNTITAPKPHSFPITPHTP